MRRLGIAASVVVASVCLALGATAFADPDGFTVRPANGNYYGVDLGTGALTALGGAADTRGLAMGPDGRVYGADGQNDQLVSMAAGTPIDFQIIGPFGVDIGETNGAGLAFTPDGRLWMSAFIAGPDQWRLFSVNPSTGAATLVGNLTSGAVNTEVSGLAAACDGTLYGTGTTNLYVVDPASAALTTVGALGPSLGFSTGLDFDAAGVLRGIDENGHSVTIDTATGAATLVTNLAAPTTGMTGLAIAPVVSCAAPPEPAPAITDLQPTFTG